MVVDTSAILAIYFEEPTANWVADQIDAADRVVMSTVNLAEVFMHFRDRKPSIFEELQTRLLTTRTEFIAPTVEHAILVARARFTYPLNFGDCFAYALAKAEGLPLLALDRDFRNVDIPVVLPPTV